MNKNEWLKKAMERYNVCPLFNGRENGEIEDLCRDGLVFIIKPLVSVKSQSGRTFRPIEVVGFGR